MALLERESELLALTRALEEAGKGSGRVVVVSAEAGGGKTALLEAFLGDADPPRVMRGACADLSTPLPFGPLLDLARSADPALESSLLDGAREAAMNRLLDLLAERPRPAVLVIEDLHWVDQASADALTVVAERIEQLPALLVLTYRPEHLERDHAARRLMWKLPPGATQRLELAGLTAAAVSELLPDGVDAVDVVAVSGGNPFYVTELAGSEDGLPPTVTDAVLARVDGLAEETRELLELVSIVPGRMETAILDAIAPGWEEAAEPAEQRQIINVGPDGVAFRHELARQAIESDLLASRRRRLHGSVLAVASDRGLPAGRVMHHAAAAGDGPAIVRFGPVAAAEARHAGSHREAAAHLERVLAHSHLLDDDRRAVLEEQYAVEAWTIDRPEASERASRAALDVRRSQGDVSAVARNLRRIARVRWFLGAGEEAEALLDEAIELLGDDADPAETAMALAYRTLIAGIRHSGAVAAPFAERAIAGVDRLDPPIRSLVLNDVGTVEYLHGGPPDNLLRSIEIAERHRTLHTDVVRGHVNLAIGALHHRDHALAEQHLRTASAYAREHQVAAFTGLMSATFAQIAFERGEWPDAERLAAEVLGQPSFAHLPAQITMARLKVRRGDADATSAIEEAWTAALATGEAQRMAPALDGLAEHAWLRGELADVVPTLLESRESIAAAGRPRWNAAVALWLSLAGEDVDLEVEPQVADMLGGDPGAAASRWEELGMGYEAALTQVIEGSESSLRAALETIDSLEAKPLGKQARDQLRELGVVSIPRGRRRSTKANPAGLTRRQMDVVGLVVQGLTNAEIADQLYLSTRTVDHHVAAILAKLGVESRRDVEEAAVAMGLDVG